MSDPQLSSLSELPRPTCGVPLALTVILLVSVSHVTAAITGSFQTQIEGDWAAQERRLGRIAEQPEAIRAVLDRAEKLLTDLQASSTRTALERDAAALRRLRERSNDAESVDAATRIALTSEPTKLFTRSYDNLKPFVRCYEWGGASLSQIATRPGHAGADDSPLTRILNDATHVPINLPEDERRRIYLWLDANAPFYGTFEKAAHVAQRNGEAVPPPRVQ